MVFGSVTAFADDTKEIRVENLEKTDGQYSTDYEEEIFVDGERYVFDSIKYVEDKIERKVITEDADPIYKEVVVNPDTKEEEEVEVGDEPDFPETITEGGVKYVLKDTNTENLVKEGRTTKVTWIVERNDTLEPNHTETAIPEKYIDPDTGTEKDLPEEYREALQYVSTETVSEEWGVGDYEGAMTFNGYEYTTFDFEGVNLPTRDDVPFGPEHYYLILQNLNLSPELFRITSVTWSGPEYTDGTTYYRNATVRGDIYNKMCEDTYEGTIEIPDIEYSVTTATYEESDEDFESRLTATAVITYKKAPAEETSEDNSSEEESTEAPTRSGRSFGEWIHDLFTTPKGLTTLGIGLAAIIAAVTIVILISRRKKAKPTDGTES